MMLSITWTRIFYFDDDLRRFINRGGRIAPGIVPSSEEVMKATPAYGSPYGEVSVSNDSRLALRDYRDLIVTTSCGVGSLKPEQAQRPWNF